MDQLNSNTDIISRKRGKHLSLDERGVIQALHRQGHSLRAIAAEIGCSHTTIMYELRRGTPKRTSTHGRNPIYTAKRGQAAYAWNRNNCHKLGRSIEERPADVDEHEEIGHLEADTVVGKRQGKEAVVFTMVERITKHYIAIKFQGRRSTSVQHAMLQLHEEYGEEFACVFKTITADNGPEFETFAEVEAWGTKVYFAHPYSSWERPRNERHNGLLREFIPKGKLIEDILTKRYCRLQMRSTAVQDGY